MHTDEVFVYKRPTKIRPGFSVAWAYPANYAVAMAGLGYQLVFQLLDQNPDIEVRRVFTDWEEPGWKASELIGFSLSWELGYIHVLNLLKKYGTNMLSQKRTKDDPLVFGGGPVLCANPEPFADFFDVILIGDAEILIPQLISAWNVARKLPTRYVQLTYLAQIDGFYVPALYHYRNICSDG